MKRDQQKSANDGI